MKYGLVILLMTTMLLVACAQDTNNNVTFCPAVYDPVCGDDGVTYGNSCEAERAGITSYTPGECIGENTVPQPIEVCPAVYDPVCGLSPTPECTPAAVEPCELFYPRITYSNECEMEKAGAEFLYVGECGNEVSLGDYIQCTPQQLAAQMCTREYMPVCGDDGITYSNKCTACVAQVYSYKQGECA